MLCYQFLFKILMIKSNVIFSFCFFGHTWLTPGSEELLLIILRGYKGCQGSNWEFQCKANILTSVLSFWPSNVIFGERFARSLGLNEVMGILMTGLEPSIERISRNLVFFFSLSIPVFQRVYVIAR